MYNRLYKLASGTFAVLGAMCITSGLAMPHLIKFDNVHVEKLHVEQKKVASIKSNEIKLKTIEVEVNSNLSIDVKDYLENPNDIEDSIIKRLKLDISNVNSINPGVYNYQITFNKKIYNGTVKVKAKPLPIVDNMTLIPISIETGQSLPTDISNYIKENLNDEVKKAIKLDLTNININKAGKYLYSVSYNGKFYTSTVTVYEPKALLQQEDENETDAT